MTEITDLQVLLAGDVCAWINEGGAISLLARDKHNDPVEMNEDEAQELIAVLTELVRKCRS